jgi:two-component system OmpR family sensor kinase
LAICYRIVAAHHGRIDVDSTPGRGTTVRITLPPKATE